jgi:hypothetical protein
MKQKTQDLPAADDLFRSRLENVINRCHVLVKLTEYVDWAHFDEEAAPFYA